MTQRFSKSKGLFRAPPEILTIPTPELSGSGAKSLISV